jgi:hypothetical protein
MLGAERRACSTPVEQVTRPENRRRPAVMHGAACGEKNSQGRAAVRMGRAEKVQELYEG